MTARSVIEADLTWIDGRFEPAIQVELLADGTIGRVGPGHGEPDLRLTHQALLPGMINAHSHSFQRGLRGSGETFPEGSGSFWSWREAMYALVGTLDAESLYRWSHQCFREMLRSGITSVGEFHYLHHAAKSRDFSLDQAILRAASDAGIRIVLLQTHYNAGGVGTPLSDRQARFDTGDSSTYLTQLDRLGASLGPRQTIGMVAHSVRGVPVADIAALYEESQRRALPFHMHVEEQRQEIADFSAATGKRPLQFILDRLDPGPNFTAVHCTHSQLDDLDRLIGAGANICITPTTEANLGDGIPLFPKSFTTLQRCLGTDSNSRVSMIEEMRWLEYTQRLRQEKRGIFTDENGRVASDLFSSATASGARSLSLNAGSIRPGGLADLFTVDLAAPSLHGFASDSLIDSVVFGSSEEVVLSTCVGGQWQQHRRSFQGT